MAAWSSEGLENIGRSMLLIGLLGCVASANASRIVPAAPARSGARASGVHPILGTPLTGLAMARSGEVPDPLGVRAELQLNPLGLEGSTLTGAYPPNLLEGLMASERVAPAIVNAIKTDLAMAGNHEVPNLLGVHAELQLNPLGLEGSTLTGAYPPNLLEGVGAGERVAQSIVREIKISTQRDLFAAENELEAVRKMLGQGVFLPVRDVSYSRGGEVPMKLLLQTAGYSCTFRELLDKNKGKLDAFVGLDLAVDIGEALEKLRRNRIAHEPPSTSDILIVGDPSNPATCRAVLSSSLTNTNIRVRSSRAALGRALTFKGRDRRAEMLSKAEVKEADLESLEDFLFTMDDFVTAEDHKKLVDLSNDKRVNKKLNNDLVYGVKQLREKWLIQYPQDGLKRMATRMEAAYANPVSTKRDDEVGDIGRIIKATMREVASLMRQASADGTLPEGVAEEDELDEVTRRYQELARRTEEQLISESI